MVETYWSFRRTCCHQHQSIRLTALRTSDLNKRVFLTSFTYSASSIRLILFSLIKHVIKRANEDPCYDNFSNFKYFHFLTYTKFHKCSISSTKLKIYGHSHEVKKGAYEGTITSEPWKKGYVNYTVWISKAVEIKRKFKCIWQRSSVDQQNLPTRKSALSYRV